MENQKDLVEIVESLKLLVCVKALRDSFVLRRQVST